MLQDCSLLMAQFDSKIKVKMLRINGLLFLKASFHETITDHLS